MLLLELVRGDEFGCPPVPIAGCRVAGGETGNGDHRLVGADGLAVEVADGSTLRRPRQRSDQPGGQRDVLAGAGLGITQGHPGGVVAVANPVAPVPGRTRGGLDPPAALHLGPVRG